MKHEPFKYKTPEQLLKKASELGIELPFQAEIDPLFRPLQIGSLTVPNRLAVQPMEACDSENDGSPSELTFRRYRRYAKGGSGMIWFEATSVVQEGRSNPRQLMLNRRSVDGFKRLVEATRKEARQAFNSREDPLLVIQLTHSGRISKPEGIPINRVACRNPYLDKDDESVFSDDELKRFGDLLIEASILSYEAGFDAVDIKACHGYLVDELLGAHTRTDSRYGGSFENRIRLLLEVVEAVHREVPDLIITVRLNATDGIPYPYGFGVEQNGSAAIDLTEPKLLIKKLIDKGCTLFNITAGMSIYCPQMVRPFNKPVSGASLPDEHPLQGVARLIDITAEIQRDFPAIPMVGSGYSWLSRFFPFVGAAVIKQGMAAFVGMGRGAFACPEAPLDLMSSGRLDPKKLCIACSRCTELMRKGRITGCAIRDREIYAREYRTLVL